MTDIRGDWNTLSARYGDGIVYLDLSSDSYSCEYDPPVFQEDGTFVDGDSGPHLPPNERGAHSPRTDLISADLLQNVSIDLSDVVLFTAALAVSLCSFHGKSVHSLIAHVESMWSRSPSSKMISESSYHVSRKFEMLITFLPARPSCLFKSFFHLIYLNMMGFRADWVFGVPLFPFYAHCWLENEAYILGDRADYIAFYSPIMKVAGSEA